MKTKPLNEIDYTVMERLQALRKETGKTRQEISDELKGDITVEQMKSYELKSRYSEPSYKHLIALAKYYNVTTDYLLGVTSERNDVSAVLDDNVKKFVATLTEGGIKILNYLFKVHENDTEDDKGFEKDYVDLMESAPIHPLFQAFGNSLENRETIDTLPEELSDALQDAVNKEDVKLAAHLVSEARRLSVEINKSKRAITYDMVHDLSKMIDELMPDMFFLDLLDKEVFKKAMEFLEDHKDEFEDDDDDEEE